MKPKTKSPLKAKPLRYAGQSLDEAIDDLLNDQLLYYLLVIAICLVTNYWEWTRFYNPLEKPPVAISIISIPICIFCVYKIYRHIRRFQRLKLGRSGERAVGQYLELFRESGAKVYHDILGDNFNVDHVVISNKGIFVIETKTYSKPAKGDAVINFDGERVMVNGKESKKDVVTQARAATSYIKKILTESTGKEFDTFPVVLFPGWFIEGVGNKKGKMWVLEPKAFRKFVENRPVKLREEDVALASYHLSRHIRAS